MECPTKVSSLGWGRGHGLALRHSDRWTGVFFTVGFWRLRGAGERQVWSGKSRKLFYPCSGIFCVQFLFSTLWPPVLLCSSPLVRFYCQRTASWTSRGHAYLPFPPPIYTCLHCIAIVHSPFSIPFARRLSSNFGQLALSRIFISGTRPRKSFLGYMYTPAEIQTPAQSPSKVVLYRHTQVKPA